MAAGREALLRQSKAVLMQQLAIISEEFRVMNEKARGLIEPVRNIYELARRLAPNRKKILDSQQDQLELALETIATHSYTQEEFLEAGIAVIAKKKLGMDGGDPMVEIRAILQNFGDILVEIREKMNYLTDTLRSTCFSIGVRNLNYPYFKLE